MVLVFKSATRWVFTKFVFSWDENEICEILCLIWFSCMQVSLSVLELPSDKLVCPKLQPLSPCLVPGTHILLLKLFDYIPLFLVGFISMGFFGHQNYFLCWFPDGQGWYPLPIYPPTHWVLLGGWVVKKTHTNPLLWKIMTYFFKYFKTFFKKVNIFVKILFYTKTLTPITKKV